jgi:hypothetical protein
MRYYVIVRPFAQNGLILPYRNLLLENGFQADLSLGSLPLEISEAQAASHPRGIRS